MRLQVLSAGLMAGALSVAAAAEERKSVSQHGITWTFSNARPAGKCWA